MTGAPETPELIGGVRSGSQPQDPQYTCRVSPSDELRPYTR